MALFTYTALDQNSAYIKGHLEARTQRQAAVTLERQGYLIVNVNREQGWSLDVFLETLNHRFLRRVSALDKIFFTRNLATTIEAGVALDQGLKITEEQVSNVKLKRILEDIHHRVQQGEAFHSALARHPHTFSPFYTNLIRVAESSGRLDDVLAYLLEQQERDYDLRTKARGAMIYPSIIFAALVVMVVMMMVFVIPKVTGVLLQYDVKLPLATRFLIAGSHFLLTSWFYLLPALIVAWYLGQSWRRSKRGKFAWDGFLLRLPIVGRVVVEFNLARFTRALTALLKSGVSIDQALEVASTVPQNERYQRAGRSGIQFIQRGIPLTEVLKGSPRLFPPLVTRMVEVGERTGKLDHMFDRLATYYEKSVETTLTNLSSVIEPVLLLSIGLVVAFVAIAVLTPVWSFSQTI